VCSSDLVYPEDGAPKTAGSQVRMTEQTDANVIDAAARGAGEGLQLALNVAAMLLAFIALIAMFNALIQRGGALVGLPNLTLDVILGYLSWPIAFIMGVPPKDCLVVGKLIGVRTVVNEFVAYLQMSDLLKAGTPLSHRSIVIATYALSSFANFSSIAIQIGGIGAIAPSRRHDLAKLGLGAMLTGSVACFMTAAIAGILTP
jgi:CNT family concentrative nucleoside transporter